MLGEGLFSMIEAVVQEVSSTVAYRVSELIHIPNSRALNLILQFVVFAALVVPIFAAIGILLLWGCHGLPDT